MSFHPEGDVANSSFEDYFQLVGMDPVTTFDTTVGLCGLMVVGNVAGWFFVDYFGRRTTMFWGAATLTCTLLLIGVLSLIKTQGALWSQVVFMAVWSFGKQTQPITASEMSSKTIPKANALEKVGNFVVGDGALQVIEYSDLPESLALLSLSCFSAAEWSPGGLAWHAAEHVSFYWSGCCGLRRRPRRRN